jgi:hypothetical protein
MEVFTNMASAMNVALTNATIQATHNTFFSDQDQGGVTRVVAVNYSIKLLIKHAAASRITRCPRGSDFATRNSGGTIEYVR